MVTSEQLLTFQQVLYQTQAWSRSAYSCNDIMLYVIQIMEP